MLSWLVYAEDFNRREIVERNIFNHGLFWEDCRKAARKWKEKEPFLEAVRSSLMYYFWSKAEHEIVLTSLSGSTRNFRDRKIDVFDQVVQHWDVFGDWLWENRKELLKRERKPAPESAKA